MSRCAAENGGSQVVSVSVARAAGSAIAVGFRQQDLAVVGVHGERVLIDDVRERALHRLHDDRVALHELVEIAERVPYVVRWPAIAELPSWPGSGVAG